MKTYIINLDRRTDRWARIERQVTDAGISYERISATTPDTLPKDLIEANGRLPNLSQLGPGELACFCSHVRALRAVANGPDEWAIIIEDDAVLARSFKAVVEQLPPQLEKPCIVRLERMGPRLRLRVPPKRLPNGFQIYGVGQFDAGSCAYIVDREAARLLVENAHSYPIPADLWLFGLQFPKPAGLRSIQLVPAIAIQQHIFEGVGMDDSDSDLAPLRVGRPDDFDAPPLREGMSLLTKEIARLHRRARRMWRRYKAGNAVFYLSRRVPVPFVDDLSAETKEVATKDSSAGTELERLE